MRWWKRVQAWVEANLRRSRVESEMDAELRFHLEARAEDLMRDGVPRAEAMRRARIEFGGMDKRRKNAERRAAWALRRPLCRICGLGYECCGRARDSRRWSS
jgi:hypothetical protein